MIDPDAQMWCKNGTKMTVVEIGKSPKASERRRRMSTWLDEHITGEYVITPWLVGFEHGTEATYFQVAYPWKKII